MKRYIAHITVNRDGKASWTTQAFTAWPGKAMAAARRIARDFCDGWAYATVTAIEEVA